VEGLTCRRVSLKLKEGLAFSIPFLGCFLSQDTMHEDATEADSEGILF